MKNYKIIKETDYQELQNELTRSKLVETSLRVEIARLKRDKEQLEIVRNNQYLKIDELNRDIEGYKEYLVPIEQMPLVDEPEFKVGDYVVDDGSYLMMKVDEASNSVVCGKICYNFRYFRVRINFVCETGYIRIATPEEIKEYESALNFYKHGRNPFEVKKGDLLLNNERVRRFFVADPSYWQKNKFISGDFSLLKTTEEVNEWLGVADE